MPIKFSCVHCRKEVTAPDAAGGKRGKCPFCGGMNDIPAPPPEEPDEDLIPLAPIDEEEERRHKQRVRALYEQEQHLLDETGGPQPVPLDQREDLTSAELHHLVVNYCLDMADGRLERAETYVRQLHDLGAVGLKAVNEFLSGEVDEPALNHIPDPVLQGLLRQLRSQVV